VQYRSTGVRRAMAPPAVLQVEAAELLKLPPGKAAKAMRGTVRRSFALRAQGRALYTRPAHICLEIQRPKNAMLALFGAMAFVRRR
jgi:hypothetical protein